MLAVGASRGCLDIFVDPAYGKARHSCNYFVEVYVRAYVRADLLRLSVRIYPGHNPFIYGWISKLFDTVVVLEEENAI